MILADLASGTALGRDNMKGVIKCPIPDGLKFTPEGWFADHREFLSYVALSHEFVAQQIEAQLRREKR